LLVVERLVEGGKSGTALLWTCWKIMVC